MVTCSPPCSSSSSSCSIRRLVYVCFIFYYCLYLLPHHRPQQQQQESSTRSGWVTVTAAEWTPSSSSFTPSRASATASSSQYHHGPASTTTNILDVSSSSLSSEKFHMNIRFLPRDMFSATSSCIHSKVQVEITNTHKKAVIVIRSMMMLTGINHTSTATATAGSSEHSNVFLQNHPHVKKEGDKESSSSSSWKLIPHQFHLAIAKGPASLNPPSLSSATISSWFTSLTSVASSTISSTLTTSTSSSSTSQPSSLVSSAPSTQGLPLFLEPNQSATLYITFYPRLQSDFDWYTLFGLDSSTSSTTTTTTHSLLDRTLAEDSFKFIRGDVSGYQTVSSLVPSMGTIPFHKLTMGPDYILKHPMVQLETSYGTLRIPLGTQVKASRYNPLFLPHGLVFLDYGFVASSDSFFDNHYFTPLKYTSATMTSPSFLQHTFSSSSTPDSSTFTTNTSTTHIQDCWKEIRTFQLRSTGALYEYDIYINNPFNDTSIQITDIWMTVDVDLHGYNYSMDILNSFPTRAKPSSSKQKTFDTTTTPFPSIQSVRFNNCGPSLSEIDFCNQPKNHSLGSIIIIPPSAVKAYVRTIRWNPREEDGGGGGGESRPTSTTTARMDEDPLQNKTHGGEKKRRKKRKPVDIRVMGYLHFKTSVGDFTILLERASMTTNPSCSRYITQLENKREVETMSSASMSTKKVQAPLKHVGSSSQDPKSPKKDESPTKRATPTTATTWMEHYPDRPVSHPSPSTDPSFHHSSNHIIDVSPNYIDFGLISKPTNISTSTTMQQNPLLGKRLNVTNRMNIPLRIVRFTVMVEQSPELESSSQKRSRGYSVRGTTQQDWIFGTVQTDNLTRPILHPIYKSAVMLNTSLTIYMNMEERVRNGVILQPGETLVDAITLFPLAPEKLMRVYGLGRNGPRLYRGTILLWFAPVSMDLRQFKLMLFDRPALARSYVVEIPFVATIMYGHIEYAMEDLFFPTNRWVYDRIPMEYPLDRDKFLLTAQEAGYSLQRSFRFINRFPTTVEITNVSIRGYNSKDVTPYHTQSFCTRHFRLVIPDVGSSTHNTLRSQARFGQRWGEIIVEYSSLDLEPDDPFILTMPCALTFETNIAGVFDIPLLFFSSLLDIDIEDENIAMPCPSSSYYDENTIVELNTFHSIQKRGRECVESWYMTEPYDDVDVVSTETSSQFFKGVFDGIKPAFGTSRVENPILFSLGGLKCDEVSIPYSFSLTNRNPFPITISTTMSAIEGMGLRLGFKKVSTPSQDSSFVFHDDIVATDSPALLINVFLSSQPDMISSYEDVALYTNFSESSRWDENMICAEVNCTAYTPVIMSSDGRVKKMLHTPHAKSLKRFWSIPPGGCARFELLVKSPPREALHDKFLDTFLTKGLIMTTNARQKIPLIAEYKALMDHVSVATVSPRKAVDFLNEEVLETAFVISPSHPSHLLTSDGDDKFISVVIHNAYPDVLTLDTAQSCNRWIHLSMNKKNNGDSAFNRGNAVLHSYNSCTDAPNMGPPNFYSCAVKWLESRFQIQPLGCGESNDVRDEVVRLNVIAKYKDIETYLQRRYSLAPASQQSAIDNGAHFTLGPSASTHVSKDTMEMFHFARYLWNEISRLQMNVISGHISTTFIFNEGSYSDESKILTSTVRTPKLKSVLDMPTVFDRKSDNLHGDNILYFNMTHISRANVLFVPIRNPTGYPLRVRLIPKPHEYYVPATMRDGSAPHVSASEERVFAPSQPNDENMWWTGHSFMVKDPSMGIYLSKQNTRINLHSSIISSHLPSTYALSAFAHDQCGGNRCCHFDPATKDVKNDTEVSFFSPIGASAASGEILRGHYYSNDGYEDPSTVFRQQDNILSTFPPFALSIDSSKEIIVPPFGSVQLGPVYFRPPSRHIFTGSLFLENSLTGLETIKLEGKGGWNKLIFLDMSMNSDAENLATRFGMQAFIFPASSVDFNGAVVQSLGVTNIGDATLNITKIYLSPPIASSLNKPQHTQRISDRCQERTFRILGCFDRNMIKLRRGNIIIKLLSKISYLGIAAAESTSYNSAESTEPVSKMHEHSDPNILNGFILQPGENHIIHISHTPDCIFRSLFTMMTFEYQDVEIGPTNKRSTVDDRISLLLGYDVDHLNNPPCVPALEKLQSVQFFPTLEQDGSLGMISLIKQYIRFRFYGRGLIDFLSKLIPFILFILIVIDVVASSRNRHSHLSERGIHKGTAEGSVDLENAVYEQSTDSVTALIQLSRDEIKTNLIARYKALGMNNPLCISANGSLVKQRLSIAGGGVRGGQWSHQSSSEISNTSSTRRSSGGANTTLTDALFFRAHRRAMMKDHENLYHSCSLLPAGLGWREATRRGIIPIHTKIQSKRAPRVSFLRSQRLTNNERNIDSMSSGDLEPQIVGGLSHNEESTVLIAADTCNEKSDEALSLENDSKTILDMPTKMLPLDTTDELSRIVDAVTDERIDRDHYNQTVTLVEEEEEQTKESIEIQIAASSTVRHDTASQISVSLPDLVKENVDASSVRSPPVTNTSLSSDKRRDIHRDDPSMSRIHYKSKTSSHAVTVKEKKHKPSQKKVAVTTEKVIPRSKVNNIQDTLSNDPSMNITTQDSDRVVGNQDIPHFGSPHFDGPEETNKAVARAPPGLLPPPGFTNTLNTIDPSSWSSSDSTEAVYDANAEIDTKSLARASDDPLGAALSNLEWFGSSINIFNPSSTVEVPSQLGQSNLIPTADIFSSGNPDPSDHIDDNKSFSSGGTGRSFERVIKPQANDYRLGWTSEDSRRKDESSFNFGLDLNILNILDFLDDTVDDEVNESWVGNELNENQEVSLDNAFEDPAVYHNVGSLYEDPWNTGDDRLVMSSLPQAPNENYDVYKYEDFTDDKTF